MSSHKVAGALGLAFVALFSYSRWIEPSWIEVTRHQVSADSEAPDAILISGDTVANEGDWSSVGILLSQLRAPLGVFVVRGNWEHWRPDPNELKVYESAGVTFLNNQARPLGRSKVWVVGLDDSLAGTPDQQRAFAQVPSNALRFACRPEVAIFSLEPP